ncbi:hypothetical protein MMC28_000581 [Mycoblastus sanguinarius]|nr:hypothetical protein [Mycoblastus sanguinarius]
MSSHISHNNRTNSPPPLGHQHEPILHMLPVDIISRILDYLPPDSAISFSFACRRLHTLCAIASAKKLIEGGNTTDEEELLSQIAGRRASHVESIGGGPPGSLDTSPQNKESTDPLQGQASHRDTLLYAKVMAKRARLESDVKQLNIDSESNASMQVQGGSQWS